VSFRTLYTIGHSTRTIDEFLDLLKENQIDELADVRSIPRSRHVPQFNSDNLEAALKHAGIAYTHLAKLGGRRHTRKDSINLGWRNASFRGFADYMATAAFAEGLTELIHIARQRRTAILCAEAVPWRCHRSLIADAMKVKGWTVRDTSRPRRRQSTSSRRSSKSSTVCSRIPLQEIIHHDCLPE